MCEKLAKGMANACSSNLSTSDVLVNFKCCSCAKKNITKAAEKYCVECQDCFCLLCTEYHSAFPSTTRHKLHEKAEFPIDWCMLYGRQLCNKFCVQHDEIPDHSINKSSSEVNIAEDIDEICQKLPASKIPTFLQKLKKFGEVVPLNLCKITRQTGINVKLSNDSQTCHIHGSCMTEDGSLLLADYNNRKLKCVDLSTQSVKDQVELEERPFDVCQTKTTEAAVTLYHMKTIQFVSLENKMTATRKIQLDHICWGLACKDDKLFISDSFAKVYIYDMNGRIIRIVTADQSCNAIFQDNRHISISRSGDMVYVADQKKGLITLDIKGNYVSTFNDPDLVNLYGVCTDRRGNIFVCGFGDSKIVQINEEYKTKVVVIDEVTNSYSTCFDRQRNRLLVTVGISDTVKVYALE